MGTIETVLSAGQGELNEKTCQQIAAELQSATGLPTYETSVSCAEGKVLALARDGRSKRLLVATESSQIAGCCAPVVGQRQLDGGGRVSVGIIETGPATMQCLQRLLPWTVPSVQGLATSAGWGDRLGLATPGHLHAMAGLGVAPFVAQQSIREMTRTQRTAEQVMADAVWGVFEAGWRTGFGSDADHLKTSADIDMCSAAGFTMFTIDPGDHVCSQADTMSPAELNQAQSGVDWAGFETSQQDMEASYRGRAFNLDGGERIHFDELTLARAMIKYGGAVLHIVRMYRHLVSVRAGKPFELEVSVDETATPTRVAEHYFVATELKRLGVKWVSLAPRFVGEFEKGIDYKGDLGAFRQSFAQHAAVARTLGPYKLSLHSGSDKFSIYPIAAELTGGLVHLKTAGTSYLEALRVVARCNPDLFRRILDFAFTRFDTDKLSYHISASLAAIPRSSDLEDGELDTVLNGTDGRQLLHVTFGSVLSTQAEAGGYMFRDAVRHCLIDNESEHYSVLKQHVVRHVQPFSRA